MKRIILSDGYYQQFTVNIQGLVYFMDVRANYRYNRMFLDIYDNTTKAPLQLGVVIVPGTFLLFQYARQINWDLTALNLRDPNDDLYLSDFPNNVALLWLSKDEIKALSGV